MSHVSPIRPTSIKRKEIHAFLDSYWGKDVWSLRDPHFDAYPKTTSSYHHGDVKFHPFSLPIKEELQFFFAQQLIHHKVAISTVWSYKRKFHVLAEFLHSYYPNLRSMTELPVTKAVVQLRSYLTAKGYKITKTSEQAITVLRQSYEFLVEFYDSRDQFDRDIWDFRKIPGVKLNRNKTAYTIKFHAIPLRFRALVKSYMKVRALTRSIDNCRCDMIGLNLFFQFIDDQHPTWQDLHHLNRIVMETFLIWYRSQTRSLESKGVDYLVAVKLFLDYIQKAEYQGAPAKPVHFLLFSEDFPQKPVDRGTYRKYIPETVIQQLEKHIEHIIPREYIPIVILLRATGWRISDILNLRYKSCLHQTNIGWYLCGDIQKTNIKNHRVPITDEIAALIQTVVDNTKQTSSTINPHGYLFVRTSGPRVGQPPLSGNIISALNRLAKKWHIVDDQGNVYHFGNHAFRHTKAVELINNGMSLLHVQKWMAHVSPEMTLRYAEILDHTMRKSWEEATKKGLFRVKGPDGAPSPISLEDIENEDIIEWEYIRHNLDAVQLSLGYCMKPIKQPCPTQANPCLSCRNFCTTPEFVPQYELEIQRTKTVIERGKAMGRETWVEKNQQMLDRLEPILDTLSANNVHHPAGKQGREYLKGEHGHDDPS